MVRKLITVAAIVLSVAFAGSLQAQSSRDYISIVGSSTVYPFATVVAEQFGKTTAFKTPTIESTAESPRNCLNCNPLSMEETVTYSAVPRCMQTVMHGYGNTRYDETKKIISSIAY